MKKNGKIFFLIFLIVTSISKSYAQSNTIEAQYREGSAALNKFLNKELGKVVKKNDVDTCITSVVFAKFTVDSLGNIAHINFSSLVGTPQVFKTILSSVIMATNGLWLPRKINGKAVESKPFILPFIYDMETGCNVRDSEIPNGLETNLRYMLGFDDYAGKEIAQLDCVILSPLHIFSIN